MHCTICKLEMREPERSSGRAVCKKCLDETVHLKQTTAKPNWRKKAKLSQQPEVAFVTPRQKTKSKSKRGPSKKSNLQTIKSAQAVARAWRQQNASEPPANSARKLRFDGAHSLGSEDSQVNKSHSSPKFILLEPHANSIASVRNAISFGLFVFLLGQALMLGAFLVGHFGAWSIGMLFSIGGVTVSLLSVNEALSRLDRRLENDAERPAGKNNSRSRVSR